jgi:aminoglycoside phosphotransferase (APT) family kinase protein
VGAAVTDDHRRLIAALFPDVEVTSAVPIGTGWTCDTYEVNDEWIVQMPRSNFAEERLRAQRALLPELAREVPTAIPVPERWSEDPPAMMYRKLEGAACDRAPDGIWPERLGRFLYDLHMTPAELVGLRGPSAEGVRDGIRRDVEAWRARVYPVLEPIHRSECDAVVQPFLDEDDAWRFRSCLTHGDLGPEHVLVSDAGDLTGVIDWEDVSVGDPAWDFAWWLHEMSEVGERMLGAYGGPPDAAFRTRARVWYLLMPFHEVIYGLDTQRDEFVLSGVEGIGARLSSVGPTSS